MEFWAGILGALVGGVLSLAGSVYVGRRDLVRTHRIELYTVLVPQARDSAASHLIQADAAGPLERAAQVAGWREAGRAKAAVEQLEKVQRMKAGDWPWSDDVQDRSAAVLDACKEAVSLLDSYAEGLRKRIR